MQCDKFILWQLAAGRGLGDTPCPIYRRKIKQTTNDSTQTNKRNQSRSSTRQMIYKLDPPESD